jgi:F-box-like
MTELVAKANIDKSPDEILLIIFRCLLKSDTGESVYWNENRCQVDKQVSKHSLPTDPSGRWLGRKSHSDMRNGRDLVPVSCVCRRWNRVANEILYKQIQVMGECPQILIKADS